MPNLSCWSCGREIYTVAPLEALFTEERRCPRCGAIGLIPWTLRRDPRSATAVRTWVCTQCQTTEERPEAD